MNSQVYSSFPHEEEVLLQEGITYKVVDTDKIVAAVQDEGTGGQTMVQVTVIRLVNLGDKYKKMNCCARGLRYLFA